MIHREISTWYQSKGNQSGEQYKKKGEVRSLKFLIVGTKSVSYHISKFTNGVQWLETRVCPGWQLELHSLEGLHGSGIRGQWLEGLH